MLNMAEELLEKKQQFNFTSIMSGQSKKFYTRLHAKSMSLAVQDLIQNQEIYINDIIKSKCFGCEFKVEHLQQLK